MGVNICIEHAISGEDHPLWNDARHSGDNDFVRDLLGELPTIARDHNTVRPSDFAAWRSAIAKRTWPNPGRFELMIDILEKEPVYWLHISQ